MSIFKLKPEEKQFIDELYAEHYKMLYSYARMILKNEELCREAVQSTFYLAYRKIDVVMASPNQQG